VLADGRTILQQQLDNIAATFGSRTLKSTHVIVGYRSEEIEATLPREVKTIHNEDYDVTNTSKSLLRGLQHVKARNGVLWFNGDVVFSPYVLGRAQSLIESQQSFMAVTENSIADEEMKFSLTANGFISEVSKENRAGLGEAVGINYVSPLDLPLLKQALAQAGNQDYFEVGIEKCINAGQHWSPLRVSDLYAVEIDFAEDLSEANRTLLAHAGQ